MGEIVRFPTLYRIAWTDGEREGLIAGYEFRNKRIAESTRQLLQDNYPDLLLWVHSTRDELPGTTPTLPSAA